MRKSLLATSLLCLGSIMMAGAPAIADPTSQELLDRIEKLEQQNAALMKTVNALIAEKDLERLPADTAEDPTVKKTSQGLVGTNSSYAYKVLDPAEDVNRKLLIQLETRQKGELDTPVTLSGQVIAIANAQSSNRDDKFGYLMRNPTSANQIGDYVSEALIHSAQLAVTANINDWLTGYVELLYNPEQNFGSGTITDLDRNKIVARRAYLLAGDLDRWPVYAAIGKLDTPFGLNDTVSPFTNSTNWHSFAGLAYGAQVGYVKDGLLLRAMAIQGGAQFRAANTPVKGTNVPSRVNNFAVDANYTFEFGEADSLLFGASYEHGSPYCQNYPVFHFNPCDENNPAWATYGRLNFGELELLGEFAQTTEDWPGSAVPDPTNPLSIYDAQKTRSWTLGGRYGFGPLLDGGDRNQFVSLEFSKFRAGDDGAPWERQDQFVLGYSRFLAENLNLFAEYIHVNGFAPLNFVSGGNFPDGSTWSDNDAKTDVIMVGAQTAF